MFVVVFSILGLVSGFTLRAFALLVLSPLCFIGGVLIGSATGQTLGSAFWFGLTLLAVFQLSYLLGVIGEAFLNRH